MDPRNAEILNLLRTPKTYQELSDEIGVGYHTVRQYVKSLIELEFVEELPWCKHGTNQKQFRSRITNPEKKFTAEGCAMPKFIDDKHYTPEALVLMNREMMQVVAETPMLALSVPMWEYRTGVMKEGFNASSPNSAQVVEKLGVAREVLIRYVRFIEQLMSLGVWDPEHPENNETLFHKDPSKINWEAIKEAYARIQTISIERNW